MSSRRFHPRQPHVKGGYNGHLNLGRMDPLTKKAFRCWIAQRRRCTNPLGRDGRYYKDAGIRVIYGSREFIAWFLKAAKGKKNPLALECDRIDSKGNYEFGNVQLITKMQNLAKRAPWGRPVVWHSPKGDVVFRSGAGASRASGRDTSFICGNCQRNRKTRGYKYEFSYAK